MAKQLFLFPGSSPCRAVWMVCKAIELDAEIKVLDFANGDLFTEEFLKINPRHVVPTFNDDGFILWESRAIIRYLVDAYAKDDSLFPKDLKQRAIVDRMLEYDSNHIYKEVGSNTYPSVFNLQKTEPAVEKSFRKVLKELNETDTLVQHGYMAGDHVTIADISILCSITFVECIDFDLSLYPNIVKWIETMKAQSYYKECSEGFEKWCAFTKTPKWREIREKRMTNKSEGTH